MLILPWKAPVLLLLALLAAGSASGEDGHCLWYGVCGPPTTLGAHSNCLYNGTAPLLNDTKTLNTLADICPLLFEHTDGVRPIPTCCDADNVREMQQSLALIAVLFSRCPVCYYNFRKSVCQLSCSPRQSTFVQITSTKNDTKTGKPYVGGIKMYAHKNYTSGVFNSCKGVQNTQTNSPAINMMCGKWGWYRCNDVRLYEFLGHNSYAPFTIDYIITKETNVSGYEPYNPTMETCDKNFTTSTGEEVQSCSCTDCHLSCPVAPPIPPPAGDWMIGPLYGTAVVMMAVFLGIAVPFVCVFAVWHSRNAGESQLVNTAADDETPYVQEMEASLIDRWGAVMELNMQRFFQRWGTFCASHPIPVLVIGLVLATSLSFGVVRLKITTDPIDLWAAPSSRSRLEKDYFDSNFGPFYRTEMIIIRAKGLQSFNYSDGGGSTSEFGPAFNLSLLQAALQLQNYISENITAEYNNSTVRLRDICFRPLYPENQFCAIQSMLEYFQDDLRNLNRTSSDGNSSFNYLDHIKYCLLNPTEISDADFFQLPCLSKWGGPSSPFTVVGGFLAPGETLHGGITYLNATALLITFLVDNHNEPGRNQPAMAWEKAFLDYMAQYEHPHMDIAYYAERSIEDEIARESESDTSTVLISYLIMFAYISISLGQYNGSSRLLVDSKVTLGLGGVIIVLLSVLASLGVYGMLGVRGTLIVIEVIPFLVLAVGVDNIFILVQGYQRDRRQPGESLEQCVGRIVGDTAPSMLLSSFSESACFFLGALIDMPAVRAFALFAGLSLLIDFVLQITCFVSLMTLDARRQESSRFDVICCVRGSKKEQHQQEGILLRLFRNFYTPMLMQPAVRGAVLVAFLGWLCSSLAVLPYVQVGLDQEISMPEDSYVLKLFRYQQRYLSVGPPVYFVVRDGLDYSERRLQNAVCSSVGCDRHSVGAQIALAAQQPARTFVASAASNWLDDFYDWTLYGYDKSGNPTGDNACCFMHYSDHSFCPSAAGNAFDPNCTSCPMTFTPDHLRPDVASFSQYLPFFLQDNPGTTCPKGGHAAYGNAVRTTSDAHNQTVVGASYFMAYHTILKTSSDYYSALDWARRIADNMTAVLKQVSPGCSDAQVFPYSIFYVFYEQYLTMWPDVLRALAISIFTIFLVTFFLLGLDLHSAFVILLMIVTILTNLGGLMYWWDISLNAVSLVNLVMAVGISVEFCSHITRAFAVSMQPTRVLRAAEALTNMGSSVLSGITLTKFGGIIVLGFAHSQIFRIFYFRMYLGVVLYGASHGLILLPVLLSFIGPGVSPYRLWFMRRHGSRLLASSASHVAGQQQADPTEQHAVGEHSTLTHTPA